MGSEKVGYVEALRRRIGHDPIIMTCAGCAVFDGAGRLLLQQRGDDGGPWGLPGGALELGETIEAAAVRETFEETGLRVRPTRFWVSTRARRTPMRTGMSSSPWWSCSRPPRSGGG